MVPQVALLSPLAGSVFSKDDIPKIAQALGATSTRIVQVINASSQSGGHYLKDSKLHIAIVAAIVATRGVKDKKMKDSIIGKTIKQYLNAKKEFKMRHFEVYAEFGHVGVPSNLSPDNLLKMFDDIQKMTPIQAAIAASATRQNIQVLPAPAPAPVVQPPASGAAGTSAGGATGTSTAKGAIAKARPPTPK